MTKAAGGFLNSLLFSNNREKRSLSYWNLDSNMWYLQFQEACRSSHARVFCQVPRAKWLSFYSSSTISYFRDEFQTLMFILHQPVGLGVVCSEIFTKYMCVLPTGLKQLLKQLFLIPSTSRALKWHFIARNGGKFRYRYILCIFIGQKFIYGW